MRGSGASELQAGPVAESILAAEADGFQTIGLGYLPTYCSHLRCGKVDGKAVPRLVSGDGAVLQIDAGHGFPHVAFGLFKQELFDRARALGMAAMSINRSYSAGVVGWFAPGVRNLDGLVRGPAYVQRLQRGPRDDVVLDEPIDAVVNRGVPGSTRLPGCAVAVWQSPTQIVIPPGPPEHVTIWDLRPCREDAG